MIHLLSLFLGNFGWLSMAFGRVRAWYVCVCVCTCTRASSEGLPLPHLRGLIHGLDLPARHLLTLKSQLQLESVPQLVKVARVRGVCVRACVCLYGSCTRVRARACRIDLPSPGSAHCLDCRARKDLKSSPRRCQHPIYSRKQLFKYQNLQDRSC